MENLIAYAQLGVAGLSVVVILLIVKVFLHSMDTQCKRFDNIMSNHIKHNTEAIKKNTKVTNKTNMMLDNLCTWLKQNGNGKG